LFQNIFGLATIFGKLKQTGSMPHVDTNIGEQKNVKLKDHSKRAEQTKNVLKTIGLGEKISASLRTFKEEEI